MINSLNEHISRETYIGYDLLIHENVSPFNYSLIDSCENIDMDLVIDGINLPWGEDFYELIINDLSKHD